MSGGVKAGLLFGLIGLVVIFGISMLVQLVALPLLTGLLGGASIIVSCSGPLTAALVGAAAAYFGVRWSSGRAGLGAGLGASALAGVGLLLGGAAYFALFFSMVMSDPEFRSLYQQQVQQQLQELQQPQADVTAEQFEVMLGLVGPLGGLCIGTINLLFALLGGLIGGWLATRNRPPVVTPPSPPAPQGPPPLSPID